MHVHFAFVNNNNVFGYRPVDDFVGQRTIQLQQQQQQNQRICYLKLKRRKSFIISFMCLLVCQGTTEEGVKEAFQVDTFISSIDMFDEFHCFVLLFVFLVVLFCFFDWWSHCIYMSSKLIYSQVSWRVVCRLLLLLLFFFLLFLFLLSGSFWPGAPEGP